MVSSTRCTRVSIELHKWENDFAPQIRQVELLGEIPITADECVQLSKAIDLRILANFKHAWHERDYRLIVKVARATASIGSAGANSNGESGPTVAKERVLHKDTTANEETNE